MGTVTNHGLQKSIKGAPMPTSSIIMGRNLRKNAPEEPAADPAERQKVYDLMKKITWTVIGVSALVYIGWLSGMMTSIYWMTN